jgi:hypothetical protein
MLLSDAMTQPATRTKGIPRRQTAHKRPQESGMSRSLEGRAAIMALTSKMLTCGYPVTDDRE